MVERRPGPHALEFLDPDRYLLRAHVVGEMRHHVASHQRHPCSEFGALAHPV